MNKDIILVLLGGGIGIASSLLTIMIGHVLSARQQRRQWAHEEQVHFRKSLLSMEEPRDLLERNAALRGRDIAEVMRDLERSLKGIADKVDSSPSLSSILEELLKLRAELGNLAENQRASNRMLARYDPEVEAPNPRPQPDRNRTSRGPAG